MFLLPLPVFAYRYYYIYSLSLNSLLFNVNCSTWKCYGLGFNPLLYLVALKLRASQKIFEVALPKQLHFKCTTNYKVD